MLRMMHYQIVIPINEISQKMQLFSQDSTKKPEPLNIPKGDEIGDIADSFEKMTDDIRTFEEIKKAVIEIEGNTPKARKILLACDEVLSNIARYSEATALSCTIDKSEENIKMMFIDDGIPFDQTKVKVENKDFDDLDSGGMGLRLIRQSVESMAYERSNDKNILTLNFVV